MPASDTEIIDESLEKIAAVCDDLTPLVYRRLHELHPEAMSLFELDSGDMLKGSMLSQLLSAVLDLAAGREYIASWMHAQYKSHVGFGVTDAMYRYFNMALLDTLKALLGDDWTSGYERAWRAQLDHVLRILGVHDVPVEHATA